MENNFNWKRFWNLFHYEYAKVRALCVGILIMAVAVVLISKVLMMLPNLFSGTIRTVVHYMLTATITFIYIGLILTSVMFGFSGSNKTLIPDLMIPASNAEKFGAKFLVYLADTHAVCFRNDLGASIRCRALPNAGRWTVG